MKKERLKSLIIGLFLILFVLVLCIAQVVVRPCGDVNSSGVVDVVDALMIARVSAGLTQTNYNSSVADVSGDNAVTVLDALLVARYSAGLISSFPGCNNTTPTPTRTPTATPTATPTPIPSVTWQGTSGYATRFWDCCKPHCAWQANVPSGMTPLKVCTQDGASVISDAAAKSSCDGGSAYMCFKFIPYAVDSTLSYGFAATSSGDVCGKCFELAFTGHGKYSDNPGNMALKGKRMIVMAINIGYDVGGGQFDLLIPGGGVGAFNGCSTQWGIPNDQLGAQYGGLLTACQQQYGYDNLEALKSCLRSKNDALFRSRGLTQLAAGLDWFIDWFQAADNPTLVYRQVPCPQALIDTSGLRRP